MSWYTTGTVNLTKGSKIVTGVGTKWANSLSGVSTGRMLILPTTATVEIYEIESIQSDTQLTLAENYSGATVTNKTYKIPTSPSVSIEQFSLEIASSLAYHQKQLDGWQNILTGSGDVTLTAPDGRVVTIKSQKALTEAINNAVIKSGGTMTGNLTISNSDSSAVSLKNNKNEEWMLRIHLDGSFSIVNKNSDGEWKSRFRNDSSSNTWRFENTSDVTIGGKSILKKGDYGIGAQTGTTAQNCDEHLNSGFYGTNTAKIPDLPFTGDGSAASLLVLPSESPHWKVEQLSVVDGRKPKIYYRTDTKNDGKQTWYEAITTANAEEFTHRFLGDLTNKSLNDLTGTATGNYFQGRNNQASVVNGYPIGEAGDLVVKKNGADGAGCSQIYTSYRNARQFIRNYRGGTKTWEPWVEQITTANSTVDSNGFYKKASPILRLYGVENVENVEGFKKSGYGLVNDLAAGVTAKRIDIGHYEIHGSKGFSKESWYIQLPEDANGNKKFFAEYSVNKKNVITVKTFTKKFDFEKCEVVAGEPVDITEGRWIDVRLEMPIIEDIESSIDDTEIVELTTTDKN